MTLSSHSLLIPGTLKAIVTDQKSHPAFKSPRLQVIHIKKLVNNTGESMTGTERHRLMLSDGQNSIQAMFGTPFAEQIANGIIKEKSIIRLMNYVFNSFQKKGSAQASSLLLVPKEIDFQTISYLDEIVGNPIPLTAADVTSVDMNISYSTGGNVSAPSPVNPYSNPISNSYQSNPYQAASNVATNPYQVQSNPYQAPPSNAPVNPYQAQSVAANPYQAPPSNAPVNPYQAQSVAANPYQAPSNVGPNAYQAQPNPYQVPPSNAPVNPYHAQSVAANPYQSTSAPVHPYQAQANPYQAQASPYQAQTNPYQAQANLYQTAPSTAHKPSQVDHSAIHAIETLSPYNSKWLIKARVTNKSPIKTWTNAKGEGKLFNVTLVDETGEIRATAFNDVADRLFPIFEVNKVFYVSQAQVKVAKKQFSNVNNDYEISLDSNTIVEPCFDDVSDVPIVRYHFCPLVKLNEVGGDSFVDVIGVVSKVNEVTTLTKKSNLKQMTKREIEIADMSGTSVTITLWEQEAVNFSGEGFPVLAIKGARVSEFNGVSLSVSSSSTMTLNPDIREAHELKGWFDSVGRSSNISSLTTKKTVSAFVDDRIVLSQIKEKQLGQGDKPDYFTVVATVTFIRSEGNIVYPACPTSGCNKKVTETGPGQWRCEKCQKIYAYCDYRYVLSINVGDHTGQQWLSLFNEQGQFLLNKSAAEVNQLKENDAEAYQEVFKMATFKTFLFKVKAKQDSYGGEQKLRCQVMTMTELDYDKESGNIINTLQQYL